jgi:hypothetical protein
VVEPAPPTTISYAPQSTSTVFGSGAFNQLIAGEYYPIEEATVTIDGQGSSSPGGGGVVVTDANGDVICAASVSAVPVTAWHTGTSLGIYVGIGYVYAQSSSSANVP